MAETYDDEIVDLTDLMEEGEPAKKQHKAEQTSIEKHSVREPESFDLGKEISLDEELMLDTESAPAAEEKMAPETPAEEPLPEEPSKELPVMEPPAGSDDLDALAKEPAQPPETLPDFSAPDELSLEEPESKEQPPSIMKTRTPPSVSPVFDAFFKETIEEVTLETTLGASEPIPARKKMVLEEVLERADTLEPEEAAPTIETAEPPAPEAPTETLPPIESDAIVQPVIPEVTPAPAAPPITPPQEVPEELRQEMEAKVQAAAEQLKAEVPALLEGIVRPVMDDLIREITQTTRDILPGIVEKIIREEIEKLKKLD
ncbi:MAG: hypothetical protein ABFD81_02860 [Syntrophaceae bacterium]